MFHRIYIRFFLTVIAVLVILTVVVGTVFNSVSDYVRHERDKPIAGTISYSLADPQGRLPELTDSLKTTLERIAEEIPGKLWITRPDGSTIFQTFEGEAPKPQGLKERKKEGTAQVVLHDGSPAAMHFVYTDAIHREGETIFFLVLATTIVTLALLAWPMARHIAKPIANLREGIARFAAGDLSARVDLCVCRKNEMAVLTNAFNDMAERIECMISSNRELSANISHEMRSPLTRLRIMQQTLVDKLSDTADERTRKTLATMEREIEAMDDLIERILKFSKLHMQEDVHEQVAVGKVLAAVTEAYSHLLDSKNIRVSTNLDPHMTCRAHAEYLRWMLDNIVGNAAKFTPDHGTLHLDMTKKEDRCVITARNTAAQLPPDELDTIFELFTRGSNQTAPGTGLGLALVQRVAERHGGSARAQSTPDEFILTVELPT